MSNLNLTRIRTGIQTQHADTQRIIKWYTILMNKKKVHIKIKINNLCNNDIYYIVYIKPNQANNPVN